MAKDSFLYGSLLPAAVCLCVLLSSRIVAQQASHGRAGTGAVPLRAKLQAVYTAELGVRERSGNNDGVRVEQYLRYTGLGKGNEWCAAFVSWCYGQAGRTHPRNPWGPAMFPLARVVYSKRNKINILPLSGDVFGIWHSGKQRISHVGFVAKWEDKYLITVEGNSNNAVACRRRLVSTIYKVADWVTIP